VLGFTVVYFYLNVWAKPIRNRIKKVKTAIDNNTEELAPADLGNPGASFHILVILGGIIGGFITSKVGSGSDTFAFIFGVFIWNEFRSGEKLADNCLTASSVVIMAIMSIFTSILRMMTHVVENGEGSGDGSDGFAISREVILCWGATAPIVVMGAPIGSLILTPKRTLYLRRMFYLCAVGQFASFGVLKIKDNVDYWIGIIVYILLIAGGSFVHFRHITSIHERTLTDAEKRIESCNDSSELDRLEKTFRSEAYIKTKQFASLLSGISAKLGNTNKDEERP